MRSCISSLDWNLDVIEDFNRAISQDPEDAFLYFERASSKDSIGDVEGNIADLQEAIRLSKIDNARNKAVRQAAK